LLLIFVWFESISFVLFCKCDFFTNSFKGVFGIWIFHKIKETRWSVTTSSVWATLYSKPNESTIRALFYKVSNICLVSSCLTFYKLIGLIASNPLLKLCHLVNCFFLEGIIGSVEIASNHSFFEFIFERFNRINIFTF
jgi:hypothetical protein